MTILVTGAAGFIGAHVCRALQERGADVVGIDNLNPYYDVGLKKARLEKLAAGPHFRFLERDISDRALIDELAREHPAVHTIVHLAAQAGVRYSLQNPFSYVDSNVTGHLVLLELARRLDRLDHLIYASSSSVYGGNTKIPFSVEDRVDTPVSMYAATKRMTELMSHTYAHLFDIPATGFRFFTVYGPWGRPDMAAFLFTRAILAGEPIRVFNHGRMKRDFTYIDDIVAGVLAVLDKPPQSIDGGAPQRVYNLGNHRSEDLMHFIEVLESALGRKAEKIFEPLQPGDVPETFADIEASRRDFGFDPRTTIEDGLPRFVAWYRDYYGV
ncbi:MAG: NAD-dependent epimerase/dehydratase family protein [Alphaproteobacteria bacterium]